MLKRRIGFDWCGQKANLNQYDVCVCMTQCRISTFAYLFYSTSLSSETHNKARILNSRAFGGTQSMSPHASWCFRIWFQWTSSESLPAWGCNISFIVSHKFIAGIPSIHNPASSDINAASVLLWTYVDQIYTERHLTLIFEAVRFPAKSASWNNPSLQSVAWFPTWQYCLSFIVWRK